MRSDGQDEAEPRPWPALVDLATAAAFLQMSRRSALRLLTREDVRPLQLGLRLRRWRRSDLEILVSRLAARADSAPEGVEAALARVEERVAVGQGKAGGCASIRR